MNRGARRAAVFADDATRQMFLDHLAALPNRRGVVIHAYALKTGPSHPCSRLSCWENLVDIEDHTAVIEQLVMDELAHHEPVCRHDV
jgi:hypothetical protein